MADEYLPPVVTKLQGEIADLLGKLAEAKAAIDAFSEDVGKRSEASARRTGARSADALIKELSTRLKTGRFTDLDVSGPDAWWIRRDIFAAFEKAGADGGHALLDRFAKTLGTEGMQTFAGTAVMDAFNEFGQVGGAAWVGGFKASLKAFFSSPASIAVGTVVVASIVSALGAALQGLTLGAIGLGGFAAAIVGQLGDPAVKQAISDLGAYAKDKFADASASFRGPILSAISDLIRQTGPIFDTLKQNFADLAPYLRPFIDSIGVFFKAAAPGWTDAVKAAGPVLIELARDAQMMGNAFSIFFREISDNKGAVEGLDWLLRVLAGSVVALGGALEGLSNLFDVIVHVSDWVMHNIDERIPVIAQIIKGLGVDRFVDGIAKSYDGYGLAADHASHAAENLTQHLNAQKTALDKLIQRWSDWFGQSMNVEQATLAVKTGMMDLTDSIAQNGKTFNENTREGAANYNMLLTEIGNLKAQYDAEVAAGMSTKQATQLFQDQYDQLIKNAQQNGLTADQVARINAQFGQLLNILNSLNGKVVTYYVQGIGNIDANSNQFYQGPPSQFHGGLAKGGFVRAAQGLLPPRFPGTLVLAGEPETGGEVMIPQRGISQRRAAALGMVAMAPYGMTVGPAGGGGDLHVHVMLDGREVATATYADFMALAGQRRRAFGNSGLAAPYNPNYPTGNTL